MTNNLMRDELAPGQVNNQYATVNTADGRIDAALTEPHIVTVGTLGTYTVTADDLTKHFEFVLEPAGSPPIAIFDIILDQDFPRGLVLITNNCAFDAHVTATGQTLPDVVVEPGFTSLLYIATADAILISAGAGGYVPISGGTMTGNLRVPAGNVGAPGLQIGDADTGFYQTAAKLFAAIDGVEAFRLTANGLGIGGEPASQLHIFGSLAAGGSILVDSDGGANNSVRRYSANSNGPVYNLRKARGSIAAPGVVQQNDFIGSFQWGYQNVTGPVAFTIDASIQAIMIAATPSPTDGETRLSFSLNPPGAVTLTEIMRLEHATGFSMFGANVVIDQNRNHRFRSYTIATLPAHVAGLKVYCSDTGGGPSTLLSDGTNWIRQNDGFSTTNTTAAFSRTHLTHANITELTGAIGANRNITLGAAPAGTRQIITSIGAHAFYHDVGPGLNVLLYTNQWVEMVTDGTTWRCAERGYVLPPIALGFYYAGVPPVSTRIWQFVATEAFQLPDQYVGSQGYCQTAPGATIAFDVRKNNVSIGTITFTSANVATFVNAAAGVDQFAIGDRLSVHSPAALSTLADLAITLVGTKQ